MSTIDSPTNRQTGRYLDELMKELQLMTNLYETNHTVKFRNAHNLLVREIQRALDVEMMSLNIGSGEAGARVPAGHDETEAYCSSPLSTCSRRNSFTPMTMPPKRWLSSPEKETGSVEKSDKLYFPEENSRNSNPIGRLIGPRGMTIRQLEKDFACKLFIRGKGCTKDEAKEERLRGKPGWEHLDEPIHVLISTRGDSEEQCTEKLNVVKDRLRDFLENPDSELKRAQLMQLAVIEGNLK